ncbi:MAG: ABC transporter substrate-binding protein [Desulfuromonadales bacterium]|nr:ABC transporter substrate-binding protein [Desulfuromonadales bacterium]
MQLLKRSCLIASGLLMLATLVLAMPSPREQVQQTVEQVLEVLRNKAISGQPRREALSRLIRARFDFAAMSQRTLGKHWKDASAQEQARFVELFSDLLEASYIGRIEAYSGEIVSYRGERIEGDMAEVDTSVHSGNVDIPINYRLVHEKGGWFVYDVIIEEVSLIKNYRSSYGEIVRKEGYPGLFARMEAKIRELRAAPPKGTKG